MAPGDKLDAPVAASAEPAASPERASSAASWTLAGDDLARAEAHLRGFVWPIGQLFQCLAPAAQGEGTGPGGRIVLSDPEGARVAVLDIVASEPSDAGVRVAGRLSPLELPLHDDFPDLRLSASEVVERVRAAGRRRVLAYAAGPVLHAGVRAALVEMAGELDATLLVLVGAAPGEHDDSDRYFRLRSIVRSAAELPADRTIVVVVPMPRGTDAAHAAVVSAAAGATHLAWEEGPAGAAGADEAARSCGLTLAPLHPSAYDPVARRFVPARHASSPGVLPSPPASDVESWLWTDASSWLLTGDERASVVRAYPRRSAQGFTVFFTGLSGSGKSTIARALRHALMERTNRAVTLLDGDRVRRHLSAELGFSREHRERNVLRIAWVAAEITNHGGIALCAPIAPYEATRREARRMIEAVGGFVLIHVATPLEACEARDRKGLYARARAGQVPQFTGISDPYEPPADAALTIDTRSTPVQDAVSAVLATLAAQGYLVTP